MDGCHILSSHHPQIPSYPAGILGCGVLVEDRTCPPPTKEAQRGETRRFLGTWAWV